MGFFSSRGPDERRNNAAQQSHAEKNGKALRAGDPKHTRLNDKHSQRTNDARRQGR